VLPHNDLRRYGETRHEQRISGLPEILNSDVRSIQMVTDAKPSDENVRKEEFIAKKPFFNISFQSKS
jgi:hypothetical protein